MYDSRNNNYGWSSNNNNNTDDNSLNMIEDDQYNNNNDSRSRMPKRAELAGIQSKVIRMFKLNGLSLKTDAMKAILSILHSEEYDFEKVTDIIKTVKENILAKKFTSSIINSEMIENVVVELSKDDADIQRERIQLVDAFTTPELYYDPDLRTFRMLDSTKRKLYAPSNKRNEMFRNRLLLIQQRLQRHVNFSKTFSSITSRKDDTNTTISTIDSLLGSSGDRVLFGCLIQVEEGCYYLEDKTGAVPLSFGEHSLIGPGLFTEGCMVLVDGCMDSYGNGQLEVNTICFPPLESRRQSFEAIRSVDLYGLGLTPLQIEGVSQLEKQATELMCIILSDVHLESPQVCYFLKFFECIFFFFIPCISFLICL